MKNKNKVLRKYCKEVSRYLPCSGSEKKKILHSVTSSLEDYVLHHTDVSTQDIEKHFGSAKTVAFSYIENTDSDILLKNIRLRRTIKCTVIAIAVVAVLLWTSVVGWAAYEEWNSTHGWRITTITENNP